MKPITIRQKLEIYSLIWRREKKIDSIYFVLHHQNFHFQQLISGVLYT